MNVMYVGGGEFFGWVLGCFFLILEDGKCSQEGRQTKRMGGKEAEDTFNIKIVCVS